MGLDWFDMEAAGVARLAAMRCIPFYCIKGSAMASAIGFLISIALVSEKGANFSGSGLFFMR